MVFLIPGKGKSVFIYYFFILISYHLYTFDKGFVDRQKLIFSPLPILGIKGKDPEKGIQVLVNLLLKLKE